MLPFAFDDNETQLLFNTEVFPLKRKVNAKLFALFEHLKQQLKDTSEHKQFNFPPGTDAQAGKISRGENYDDFPWVLLDFPKRFHNNDIFALRTLFWYGHYFSCSFVVAGTCLETYRDALITNKNALEKQEIFLSVGGDPWDHAIEAPHFIALEKVSAEEMHRQSAEKGFIKLSLKIKSSEPEIVVGAVTEFYRRLLNILS